MTGTAETEAAEFHQIYKLGVVPIPTNKPMIRKDQPDLVYKTEEAKFDAVVEDIVERHESGQPVLVGTTSVEKSEYLSQLLAQARRPARGAERQEPRARGARSSRRPAARAPSPSPPTWPAAAPTSCSAATPSSSPIAELHAARPRPGRDARGVRGRLGRRAGRRRRRRVAAEHEEVVEARRPVRARHRAARVAPHRQPAARSFRPSGRPGREPVLPVARRRPDAAVQRADASSAVHGPRRTSPDDVPIESKMVTRAIRSPRRRQVEAQNFEIRKNVLKYDDVLNRQREVIYGERRQRPRGRGPARAGAALHRRRRSTAYVDGGDRRGLRRGLGPRRAVDARCSTLYPISITIDEVDRARPAAAAGIDRGVPAPRRSSSDAHDRLRRAARRSSASRGHARARAPRRALGARPQAGASTSTRWTTCRRASACARWPSATRWSSTSARASDCSSAMMEGDQGGVGRLPVQPRGRGRGEQRGPRGAGPGAGGHRSAQREGHGDRAAQRAQGPGGAEAPGPAQLLRTDRGRRGRRGRAPGGHRAAGRGERAPGRRAEAQAEGTSPGTRRPSAQEVGLPR